MGTLVRKAKAGDAGNFPVIPSHWSWHYNWAMPMLLLNFRQKGELILSKELDEKIFNYIAALEETNDELVKTLKKCVALLTHFKSAVPDPAGWQEMLDVFQKTIEVGERVVGEKTLH